MTPQGQEIYMAACIGPNGDRMGAYKFGCSAGWSDRVKAVTANLPFTLEVEAVVPGGLFIEYACHLHLRDYRIAREYFRDCEEVRAFIAAAARRGHAFESIREYDDIDVSFVECVAGFMSHHGISIDDACRRGGLTKTYYANKAGDLVKPSRKLLAAAALVAAERGHSVRWPGDGARGLKKQKYGVNGRVDAQQRLSNDERAAA